MAAGVVDTKATATAPRGSDAPSASGRIGGLVFPEPSIVAPKTVPTAKIRSTIAAQRLVCTTAVVVVLVARSVAAAATAG